MRVVGRGPAESVVHLRRREERAVGEILEPPAASLVAHEEIELAVGAEFEHAAIVVGLCRGVVRPRMSGHGDVVCLQRAELDEIVRLGQCAAVPQETVDAIPRQRHVEDRARVCPGAAFSPPDVDRRIAREVGVDRHAQQSALGIRIHGKSSTGVACTRPLMTRLTCPDAFSSTR